MTELADFDKMSREELIRWANKLTTELATALEVASRCDGRWRDTAARWNESRDNRQKEEHVFRCAVRAGGEEAQLGIAQEECGELVACINQYRRGRVTLDDVADEVADVLIAAGKIRVMIGDRVDARYRFKLQRLAKLTGNKF